MSTWDLNLITHLMLPLWKHFAHKAFKYMYISEVQFQQFLFRFMKFVMTYDCYEFINDTALQSALWFQSVDASLAGKGCTSKEVKSSFAKTVKEVSNSGATSRIWFSKEYHSCEQWRILSVFWIYGETSKERRSPCRKQTGWDI